MLDRICILQTGKLFSGKKFSISKKDAYNATATELTERYQNGEKLELASILDIFEGATKGKVKTVFGHGSRYWTSEENLPTEAFAEMFEASINDPKALSQMQRMLPKSYDVFKEIVRSII